MAKHQLGKKAKCYDAHTRTDGCPDVGFLVFNVYADIRLGTSCVQSQDHTQLNLITTRQV